MTDYYTQQRKRNIVVGIFVILGLVAFFYLVWIFQDLPIAVGKFTSFKIYVQFPTAPGVARHTPVRFCGYQVGRVVSVMAPEIRKDLNDPNLAYHHTVVAMAIDEQYANIPSNVDIKLMKRGLGSSYIELKQHPGTKPTPKDPNNMKTAFLSDGMLLQGSTGTTSEFFPEESQKKLEKLVDNFTNLLNNANLIIGDTENRQNIKDLLANTELATEQATATLKDFQEMSIEGKSAIKTAESEMKKAANAIDTASEDFSLALRELTITMEKVNNGDGTAGKILNDGRLYENLLDSSQELQAALEQLKILMAESRERGLPIKLK